jgi:hydroxymethylglutaryl-CoA lyase
MALTNKQDGVKIIECPRDAMQGWPHFIATEDKICYLNSLLKAGFDTLDFGSFVSPKAIPQMRDTKQVIPHLQLSGTTTKLLAIIANLRGAEDAVQYEEITYLGFPFSISPTFQLRNTNNTIEQSLQTVDAIQNLCLQHGKILVIYLSMGFGNPYGDPYNADILLQYAATMIERNISIISLADTVGLASPEQIAFALNTLIPQYPNVEFGVHLHTTAINYKDKLQAALSTRCSRFDGALKGIGGCPMAQDDLVGNMPTEKMISFFEEQHIPIHINKQALIESMAIASEIFV